MKTCMMTPIALLLSMVTLQGIAQVGINIDTPQATLHIHGTLRSDSLALVDTADAPVVWNVVCDSAGNFFKKPTLATSAPILPEETLMEFEYGETLPPGVLVAVGDGKSAYMRCNGDGAFIQNESTNQSRWIAQGFLSSVGLVGIRAVNIRMPITTGTNTIIFSVCPAQGNVPHMAQAISRTETFASTSTSTGWSLFVFDPPLYVPSATQCFLVVRAYGGTNTSKNLRTVGESISGTMMISSDAGVTWSSTSGRDLEVQIFEARHWSGKIYAAHTVWIGESLRPDQGTILATTGTGYVKDFYDRAHNVIGVTRESGVSGQLKKVSVGPVVTVSQSLITGTRYFLSDSPGILGTGMSPSFFNVPVGFAVGTHRLLLVR